MIVICCSLLLFGVISGYLSFFVTMFVICCYFCYFLLFVVFGFYRVTESHCAVLYTDISLQ